MQKEIQWGKAENGDLYFFEEEEFVFWDFPFIIRQDGSPIKPRADKCGIAIQKVGQDKKKIKEPHEALTCGVWAITTGKWNKPPFHTLGVYECHINYAKDIAEALILAGRSDQKIFVMPPTNFSLCEFADIINPNNIDEE